LAEIFQYIGNTMRLTVIYVRGTVLIIQKLKEGT
jgi:hypothetical protein